MQARSRLLDVHLSAAKTIASGLKEIGLMKGNPDDAVKVGAHSLFFPHGLGHMLGLDVHEQHWKIMAKILLGMMKQ